MSTVQLELSIGKMTHLRDAKSAHASCSLCMEHHASYILTVRKVLIVMSSQTCSASDDYLEGELEDIGNLVLHASQQGLRKGFEKIPLVPLDPTPLQDLLNAHQGCLPELPCLAVQGSHCVLPHCIYQCLCILGVRQGEGLRGGKIWREAFWEMLCRHKGASMSHVIWRENTAV